MTLSQPYPLTVRWRGEQRFEGGAGDHLRAGVVGAAGSGAAGASAERVGVEVGAAGGPTLLLDCAREQAPGPVDALLIALASCVSIDVLEILAKRRTPARGLRVDVEHERATSPPRRLTGVHLRFIVDTDSAPVHVERAARLVLDGYCSVASSLDPAIPITFDITVETAP